MKKLLFLLTAALSLTLFTTSCDKNNDLAADMELIEQIVNSDTRSIVEPTDLPNVVSTDVAEKYFETYIETAVLASGLGFEIELGNGESIFFDKDGEALRSRRGPRHGHGPCGRGHRGTPVDIADLPSTVSDYINSNYTDAEIKKAKNNDDGEYFVLILTADGRVLIKFDADGNFIKELTCIHHHCGNITMVEIADLPTTITDYITNNYPDADIKKAGQKTNSGKYAVVLNVDGNRVILVFDADGNFLFERT